MTSSSDHDFSMDHRLTTRKRAEMHKTARALLDDMISTHGRVFVMFFGLDFPADRKVAIGNDAITTFMNELTVTLRYHELDSAYFWGFERTLNRNHRYPVALMLDGWKTRSCVEHLRRIKSIWHRINGIEQHESGLVTFGHELDREVMIIDPNQQGIYGPVYIRCLVQLIDLVQAGSEPCMQGVRSFGCSRVSQPIPRHRVP